MPKLQDPAKIVIPDHIEKVARDYFGEKDWEKHKSKVVATRTAFEWYAVLVQDDDEYFAIDFTGYSTDSSKWQLSNDWVGPFETIQEFKSEALVRTFL